MITIKEVKKSQKVLDGINKEQDNFEEKLNKEMREIKDKTYDLKIELDEKCHKKIHSLTDQFTKGKEKYEAKKENNNAIYREFKEILNFLEIKEKNKQLDDFQVYKYDYLYNKGGSINSTAKVKIYYQPIRELISDNFKKIFLYITKNRKPVNEISLIAVGNTIFNNDVLKIPYSYRIDAHTDNNNILDLIKEFKTEEEAKEYLNKNEKRILKNFLEEHKEKEIKYNEAIKATEGKKEWKIALLEDKKYYYENCYSHGEETDEYKAICKELEDMK